MRTPDLSQGVSSAASAQPREDYREEVPAGEFPIEALGNLSHDLNNALSVILTSSTSLLRRETADSTAYRQLELVHRSALRIHDLSEELTDGLAVDCGQIELKLAPLETGQMMHEAVEAARQLAKQRSLSLRGAEGPLWIRGDLVRLQRVFAHLLRSALSATLEGTVEVAVERRAAEACVTIHDGGQTKTADPSSTPSALPSAPNETAILHPSETQRRSLARYVSRGVVLAHGGRFWTEPHRAGGDAFLVCLPIAEHSPGTR